MTFPPRFSSHSRASVSAPVCRAAATPRHFRLGKSCGKLCAAPRKTASQLSRKWLILRCGRTPRSTTEGETVAQTIEAYVGNALDEAKISPLHRKVVALIAAGYFFDVIDFTIFGSVVPYILAIQVRDRRRKSRRSAAPPSSACSSAPRARGSSATGSAAASSISSTCCCSACSPSSARWRRA